MMPSLTPAQDAEAEADKKSRITAVNAGDIVDGEALNSHQAGSILTDSMTSEDPDAQRRIEREAAMEKKEEDAGHFKFDYYGSVRIHAINTFDPDTQNSENRLGDGASRVGLTADWQWRNGWSLFGRLESGFDVLETFTAKAQNDSGGVFTPRLYNITFESDKVYAKLGKSWSVYYKVAGLTDRFSIFGGSATGVYNAGTDGGATGTGRADNAFQTHFYLTPGSWTRLRPFNLNLQIQHNEKIPGAQGVRYGTTFSASGWQETRNSIGIGVAWHRAEIEDPLDPRLQQIGIDGDATAFAVAVKTSGERWLASMVFSLMENLETTNEGNYFNGRGFELFAQWEFVDRWWVVGGGNWLTPDDDSRLAGEFAVRYGVLGLRYTFDSFNRMAYAEWRIDDSTRVNGTPGDNEFTLGVRWDFGY